jgi:PAS domain S-box-containing protein
LTCWFQVSANRVSYGGKTALQGTIIDITKRKLAEEALVESENMYRTLLNASPEGILIINLAGRISEVSSIMLEIFGTENKHDLIGKHFIRFIHSESRKKVREVVEKTMAEGLEQDVEFILIKADRKKFVGEVSTTLIQESNGMPQSFMAIVRDISQRKEIEKQLIHTERMAGLGEMATGIAHEINQPLNTISMSLENMLMEISKTKERESSYLSVKINKIFESIYRIGKIIDHVRAFSRDQDDYIPTAFNVNESIMNSLSMVMVQYKHKAIELITDLSEGISPVIGNTFKFEQVILNLVINAKDALEEKALTEDLEKEIKISTFQEEGNIYIEVSDNGTGIKKEDIGNIMLPFYSTKEEGKGTGMGLSISFGIIKEMKGDIRIKSEVLKGTTIRITVPVGSPEVSGE